MSGGIDWIDVVRRCDSNLAVDSFGSLEDLIASDKLTESQLRSLFVALRALAQRASDKAAEMQDRRKRPWMFKDQ